MEGTIQSSALTLSQVSSRPASDFNTQRVFLEFGTGTQQSFNAYAYLQYGTGPTL
ncbi:hypothetical protein LDC_2518 [sediment metagenome]|uniref:Uncharacterized protein n=1 Tax=sediment metagenome TaxID=749907 RepID=D9PLU2_9ZZZZ